MKRTLQDFAVLACLLVGLHCGDAAAQQCDRAADASFKGKNAYRNGDALPANAKLGLCFNDRLRTGERTTAALKLLGNGTAKFDQNTVFSIERPSGVVGLLMSLGLVEGRALVDASRVEVKAGGLTARLGSKVNFEATADATIITVIEGSATLAGDVPRVIGANQQLVVTPDGNVQQYEIKPADAKKTGGWATGHCALCWIGAAIAAGVVVHEVGKHDDDHDHDAAWCCAPIGDGVWRPINDRAQCQRQDLPIYPTQAEAASHCPATSD